MPPNFLDGNDLDRGLRFAEICEKLFPGVANIEIGRILAGVNGNESGKGVYSEGAIRRWKGGGPIGNSAIHQLVKRGVSLDYLFHGEGEMLAAQQKPPAKQAEGKGLSPKIKDLFDASATIDASIRQCLLDTASGELDESDMIDLLSGIVSQIMQFRAKEKRPEIQRKSTV